MLLTKLRKQKGLTQIELSNLIGIKQSTLSSYESKKSRPSLTVSIKLAKALEVPLDVVGSCFE